MAAVPMLAGIGLMMVCCSSSSVASMMLSGNSGDDDSAGAADDGSAPEDTTPSMLKCIDTRQRAEKGWTNASNGRKNYTEAEARALCVGKTYMSLECPNANGYEVWCADDISGMPVLANDECKGTTSDTSLNNGQNGGCDAGGGSYVTSEGLNMGGWHRGAVYEI